MTPTDAASRTRAELVGHVEVHDASGWLAVIDAGALVPKHYDLFALLFGVTGYAGFDPLFAGRGLPPDATTLGSHEPQRDGSFGATWVSYAELAAVDWTREAERLDERVHHFTIAADGTERFVGKVLLSSCPPSVRAALAGEGQAREGSDLHRRRRLRRSDVRAGTYFDVLFDLMRALAGRFGPDDVRLVVWFVG